MKKLSKKLVNLLTKKKLTVSFAESCTGGLLSSSIISISGKVNEPRIVSAIQPGRVSGYPQMEKVNNHVMFAWTESGNDGGVKTLWRKISDFR